ncbi:hypothetical protein GRI97_01840 [Altererythrobacter xixiisoli]|uniref:DUF4440 domain-containing protein n=1 Tax=Croceibacterium xixiisoli TaxID=1476466 RepID=A0A6I4TQU1_9SPHN|nr:hypothetical protein [Croceibacterium xixiisoli]MXO97729.1 hypothetical protein [Croceibacterium xixiisoli]
MLRSARRAAAISLLLLTLAGCASGPKPRNGPPLRQTANASAVIAREFGFARAAQDRGLWVAFSEFSAPDAVVFVPDRARAQDWVKRRAEPAQRPRWQPHSVWSSCDGSLAVTHGGWQAGEAGAQGRQGQYVVVWRRDGSGGTYRWVLELDGALAQPLIAPEMITAQAASCVRIDEDGAGRMPPPRKGAQGSRNNPTGPGEDPLVARDGSLSVSLESAAGGGQNVRVMFMRDGAPQEVLSVQLAGSGMGAR